MKKGITLFLLIFVTILSVKAQERKKVGLVLSGGGAKGMAHIGAIKVLQEAGIPIDYIVGTSMGALVGGLYAIGYDTHTLDSLVRVQDWSFLLSDRVSRDALSFSEKETDEKYLLSVPIGKRENRGAPGFINGQNIYNLFSDLTIGYHDSLDFSKLPIPFACVSANIVDGSEIVMQSGNLVVAMRASMAIPGVFTPVRKDSLLLVDGGIINNFPVDVAKRMGADIVIGIDVQSDLKNAEELNSLTGVVGQLINLLCLNKYEENRQLVDLYIHPDVEGYSAASFNLPAIDTLIRRGEEETRAYWDDIIAIKEKVGVEKILDHPVYHQHKDSFYIREIVINGVSEEEKVWFRRTFRIKENSVITFKQLQKSIANLYGTRGFREVTYRLIGDSDYILELNLEEKNISSLNFGFRFDTEEMAAILINSRFGWRAFIGSRFSFTARLSKSPYFQMDYSFENPLLRKVGLSYRFKYNDFNLYDKGEKINAVTYRNHLVDLNLTDIFLKNFKFQVGLRYEYFDYDPFLYKSETETMDVKSEGIISYYGLAHLETFDKKYYPNKGLSFKASYFLHTDNFTTYNGSSPFSALSADFTGVIPITRRFKILPSIYGRALIGNNIAFPYMNYMGGEMPGRYMGHQMPFAGIGNIELFDKSIVVGKMQLRQRMGSRHYVSFAINYALQDDNFLDLLTHSGIWGGNVVYAYDLPIGPIEVNFSLSDWSKDFRFYFNLGFNF